MLQFVIPASEQYDEGKNEFIYSKEQVLQLEHSLVSLSKWEAKWHKPFLSKETKPLEESIDYVRCMTITQNVSDEVYRAITSKLLEPVIAYIEAPMTATTFAADKASTNREVITSEIIYYWMVSFNIPFECQKWHLNRLLTLINVCSIKNAPPKKMSKKEVMSRNAARNAARRAQLNSKG